MPVFERLRALREFERQHLHFISTLEDQHLVREIGYYQARGKPLTLKQLFLLDAGSIATIQRRLRRLRHLGVIQQRRLANDRRAVELLLSPKFVRLIRKYDALMAPNGSPAHVCGLCDGDPGRRKLIVSFLRDGLKRGDRCLLVAPAEGQSEVLSEIDRDANGSGQLVVCDGTDSPDTFVALVKRLWHEAKEAGPTLRIAGDMTWILAKKLPIHDWLDIERRLDALARQPSLTMLCVYDARRFSSGDFLRALKCHSDHARHPVMLG